MKTKPPKDPLRAARKGSREAEIEMHGKPLHKNKVHQSKRNYSRKTVKARLNGELFILGNHDTDASRAHHTDLTEMQHHHRTIRDIF